MERPKHVVSGSAAVVLSEKYKNHSRVLTSMGKATFNRTIGVIQRKNNIEARGPPNLLSRAEAENWHYGFSESFYSQSERDGDEPLVPDWESMRVGFDIPDGVETVLYLPHREEPVTNLQQVISSVIVREDGQTPISSSVANTFRRLARISPVRVVVDDSFEPQRHPRKDVFNLLREELARYKVQEEILHGSSILESYLMRSRF